MRSINILLVALLGLLVPSLARADFSGDELEVRVYGAKFSGGFFVVDPGRSYNNFDGVNPGPGIVPGFVPLTIDDHEVPVPGFEIDHAYFHNFILDFVPDASDANKGILNIRLKAAWAEILWNSNGHRLLLEIQGFDLGSPTTFGPFTDYFDNFRDDAVNHPDFPPTSPDDGFTLLMGSWNYNSPYKSALQALGTNPPGAGSPTFPWVLHPDAVGFDPVTNPYPIIFSMEISGGGPANEAPTAEAGPDQSIRAGDTVNLDGSASFDDNTPSASLIYSWSLSSPAGSSAFLTGADTATPSFTTDIPGTYIAELLVTDEGGLDSDAVAVGISSDNLAPTAIPTVDFSLAIIGEAVNFDGTGSTDPEMDALTYSWAITAAPAGSTATLVGDATDTPSLTADVEGTYNVTLTVSDFIGPGTPVTISICATTAEGFAEIQIVYSSDAVGALLANQVTTAGNQNAFGNFLAQAIEELQAGNTADAIDKLNKAIARSDGCHLRGAPDGNGSGRDWITDCVAQLVVYDLLNAAVDALTAP